VIVAYAVGAGLGHLTRLRAARHTLGLGSDGWVVVTDSRHATDPRVMGDAEVIPIPSPRADPVAARSALVAAVADHEPRLVVLDAFPAGLAGEVDRDAVAGADRVLHLGRDLRWDAYAAALPNDPPLLDEVVLVEPVGPEQAAWYRSRAGLVRGPLDLVDPDEPARRRDATAVDPITVAGAWLVVHAGPPAEVAELVAYAIELAEAEGVEARLVVVHPGNVVHPGRAVAPGGDGLGERVTDEVTWGSRRLPVETIDVYPAWPLFGVADRIITAAGANAVRQLAPWRDRHRLLPLRRRFDDQAARARRARADTGPPGSVS
jgi:hypothetical protein